MNEAQILEVIEKHIKKSVDGLDDQVMDPTKKLTDYGASSLDIVEIVSSSMRELKIKIPRTELNDISNIDGLVKKFMNYAQ